MKKNSTGLKDRKQMKEAPAQPSKAAAEKRKDQITIGLDLGDKTSRYYALDEDGEVLFERSVATTKRGMAQVFGRWRAAG
jgi:activator of 2-hydroxyglutaryl-CoA dehydratase